ncbi:MAG: hypothetical protein KIS82_12255 [Ferruginibacter sp.]|nr:hypothetical protein [Ferruginibacter sp.]
MKKTGKKFGGYYYYYYWRKIKNMKSLFFILVALFFGTFVFANTDAPLVNSIVRPVAKCTATAYGTYHAPDGSFIPVDCTRSAATCEQAQADAANCRDLNICNAVRSFGLEPSPTLNCPKVSEFENPV